MLDFKMYQYGPFSDKNYFFLIKKIVFLYIFDFSHDQKEREFIHI